MSSLTIEPWSGTKREVQFIGYNRAHTACFIRDGKGPRRAVTLHLPIHYNLRFRENPIGRNGSAPIEIRKTALHPPAFFATKGEAERLNNATPQEVKIAVQLEQAWKILTRHKHWLLPKDKRPVRRHLDKYLQSVKERQWNETAEINAEITSKSKSLAELATSGSADAAGQLKSEIAELRTRKITRFTTVKSDPRGNDTLIPLSEVTLEMVRAGWGGIRDTFLLRRWLKESVLDLDTMNSDAEAFDTHLRKNAYNCRETMTNYAPHQNFETFGLSLTPSQREALQSAVSYEIRFDDGTRCWLNDITERAITDPQEVADFEILEAAISPPEGGQSQSPQRFPLDFVLLKLGRTKDGVDKPMTRKGFKLFCSRRKLSFEDIKQNGLAPDKLNELVAAQERYQRKRTANLKKGGRKPKTN